MKNIISFRLRHFILLSLVLSLFCQCKEEDSSFDYTPPFTYEPKDSSEFNNSRYQTNIKIHKEDAIAISPYLLGVNNDWSVISSDNFSKFTSSLSQINAQNLRFPGGWESEFYDWKTNTTPEWDKIPEENGATIEQVLASNPKSLSIVVPTVKAMNATLNTEAWDAGIKYCTEMAKDAIDLTGPSNIMTVEIGNEWWLQYAGGKNRTKKLENYAHIAKEIAIFIRAEYPDAEFKLLVNGDFVYPKEFAKINEVFADQLDLIDGSALHPYAGYNPPSNSPNHHIDMLVELIQGCRDNLGKDYVHLSEWAPSKDYNNHKMYAEGANLLVEQVYEFGRSGADVGAFWPPLNTSIVGLGLFNPAFNIIYPTGQLFGDLAENFKGQSLKVTDGKMGENGERMRAIASKDENELVVYVVGHLNVWSRVDMDIEGETVKSVKSHQLFMPASSETNIPQPMTILENADYALTGNTLTFYMNENRPFCIYKFVLEVE
ncbi:hypothetical protein [Saccharicrinis aurantiacus]|uniref:hypothetical protein n=1 Tax=Saccharicrinis aurantiacus TaxID=1849719 RepID=UPI0024918935|nr:hypothetical protein [Saccharicrinis aurantiacus]